MGPAVRLAALALMVSLVTVMSVSAETQCADTDLSARVSGLEGRLSRVEDRLYSALLAQLPGSSSNATHTLAGLVDRLAAITDVLENAHTPSESPVVCERGMAGTVDEAFLTLTDDTIGREIRCDAQTDGGGWIVFQRRETGDVDFYKTWAEYRDGFGSLGGDFWLGNEALHQLTNEDNYELRIDVTFNDEKFFAYFSTIKIENESDNYRLRLGEYSGTVGDSGGSGMIHSNNGPFSTYDRDNDAYSNLNCAVTYHGAWWYNTCSAVNLNGEWGVTHPRGLRWYNGQEHRYATFTEMKIRKI